MEACFLSSNFFSKGIDLVPSIKARILLSFPKRNPNFSPSRRSSFPSYITCCQSQSSSPSGDENKPIGDNDWRSFRARLIAAEKLLTTADEPPPSPSSTDLDATEDLEPPRATIGKDWAHTIHEPEQGCLLIATEKLDGVHIFERTVILLLSTGPMVQFGIILNRPSLMSIKEMKSTVLGDTGTFSDRPLFFGGPMEAGLFLVSPSEGDNLLLSGKGGVFKEVMMGLYYGTQESMGCAAEMVKRDVLGLEDFRFFDGYCGWEKDKLSEEIRAGYWTVAACSPSVIELNRIGRIGLWEEILGLIRPKKVW